MNSPSSTEPPVSDDQAATELPGQEVSPLVKAVREAFDPEAALAHGVAGFRFRDGQVALAESIARAIEHDEALVAEAGTGTGKTFAYLVPALLSGRRVLISTGTKTLQDQLFHRDLPAVLAALGVGMKAALLKGRSNYVCHHHLERNLADGRFARRQDVAVLHRIERFAAISRTGDRAEAPGIAEDAPAWVYATSTRDNCLGQDCEHLDKCFVMHARRKALQADVIVTIISSPSAVLKDAHVKPGTHIACMGTDTKGKQEVEAALVARATVFTDEVAQSVTIGECQHAIANGSLKQSAIFELGAVINGTHSGRSNEAEVTLFDGTGVGLQDLAVASAVVDLAIAKGIAVKVDF